MKRVRKYELAGLSFGRLSVLKKAGSRNGCVYWLCRCECGNLKEIPGANIAKGHTKSCGCLQSEISSEVFTKLATKHGKAGTATHMIWNGMRARCLRPNSKHYALYGGRGIAICKRWGKFENFVSDMGEKPEGMSLDRINNDGPYSPENCRWASPREQSNNRRTNHRIVHNGVTWTATELARSIGMSPGTFLYRLSHGWSVNDAISEPLHNHQKAA